MSQATTEPTTPTTGDVLARVGETLAALQDAEQTCVEAARKLYEHTQDGNAHGAGLQENIGREMPLPVWQGTALAFQKTDGTLVAEAVDLKGEKGDRGEAGPRPEHRWDGTRLTVQSADGSWPENGVDLKGEKGDKGEIGPRPEHRWDGTRLTVQNADGSWPESGVDLKGEKGDTGEVTLSDAVDSDSGTTAASSKAVKTAYDAAIFAQKQVKTKLTKETVFYVNVATGNDTLDDGRGLSESKPFRTAQAAIDHICGQYNFGKYNCILNLLEGEFPEFLVIPEFETLTGQLRIRGAGADKTVIRGSVITRHSNGVVALEKSITVKCPGQPTPGWPSVWYGVISFSTGAIDLACTVDAGEDTHSLYKYVVGLAQMGGAISLYDGCAIKGVCDQFLFANSGALSILGDVRIEGKARNAVACAVYSGVIAVYTKADGVSIPTVTGSAEGRRFHAYLGGIISSAGQGPNYFPGTEAGIADTATGGYYG